VPDYQDELDQIVAELNRAAHPDHSPKPRASAPAPASFVSTNSSSLDQLLALAVRRAASDLLLIAGAPVTLRIAGSLAPAAGPPLGAEEARSLLLPLLSQAQSRELERTKSVDLCFSREGIGRFRANIHHQRGTVAGSIRLLPEKIPTLESLHLPAALRRFAEARQGLVLITGPTGCGKSSTLAALIDLINTHRRDHVVTIEDPIEFVHGNRQSVIEQIEVGTDAPDFAGSLRSILRQNPDVILVGEMRDPETIATVLTAAETGHLVLSTLHTNDTSQAVSRILDSFPASNQPQIRQQLSLALLVVVAQQLVPSAGGARYPAVEILMATTGVRNLIRKGDDHQLYSALSTGRAEGMITMEQSLAEMTRSGRINRETAMAHGFRSEALLRYLED
jgi:twitching motility protein PilT